MELFKKWWLWLILIFIVIFVLLLSMGLLADYNLGPEEILVKLFGD